MALILYLYPAVGDYQGLPKQWLVAKRHGLPAAEEPSLFERGQGAASFPSFAKAESWAKRLVALDGGGSVHSYDRAGIQCADYSVAAYVGDATPGPRSRLSELGG